MNRIDEFCLIIMSSEIGDLYEREDPYLIDEDERRYIDPERLNKLLQATDPNLWIVELRNALDHLNDLQSRCGDDEIDGSKVKDILATSKRCVLMLAKAYCPNHVKELRERADIKDSDREPCATEPTDVRTADQTTNNAETATESEPKRKKPADIARADSLETLRNGQANTIFEHLRKAGYLDSDFNPISNKLSERAFMAKAIGKELFDITNWGVCFNVLWIGQAHEPGSSQSQYKSRGLTAHCTMDIIKMPKNSLRGFRQRFIWKLAEAIETMGVDTFGEKSECAQALIDLAKRNGYTSTKR